MSLIFYISGNTSFARSISHCFRYFVFCIKAGKRNSLISRSNPNSSFNGKILLFKNTLKCSVSLTSSETTCRLCKIDTKSRFKNLLALSTFTYPLCFPDVKHTSSRSDKKICKADPSFTSSP